MKAKINFLYILFSILLLTKCVPPPIPEPMPQAEAKAHAMIIKNGKSNLAFKRLQSTDATMEIDNSKATITFSENFQTIEHQLIVAAKNLGEGYFFDGYELSISSDGITNDDITNTCEIQNREGTSSGKGCTATNNLDESDQTKIKFKYQGQIGQEEKLIINYKYKKAKKTEEILYKQEAIVIPLIRGSSNCDYKFIIPEGYVNLGLKNNMLTKESDTTYIYNTVCPSTALNDVIRYSPKEAMWKADMKISLEYAPKFTKDVNFIFPRYYLGAKLNNTYYRILSSENKSYKESENIDEDVNLKIRVPAENKDKVAVSLHTAFFNRLSDDFIVNLPESFYEIDTSKIDAEIISKAEEIKNAHPDKPYYHIGKFVNSHIEYDIIYVGNNLTLKEIFEGRKGVCEHYTLLYNAMLNAIGIKTIYISGWAFDQDKTSGDKSTLTHAWTAALIDEKWIELDATWGLFEGIPAGHIFKNFNQDSYSYSLYESVTVKPTFIKTPTIQMISDVNELQDPYPPHIDEEESGEDKDTDEEKDKSEENSSENKGDISDVPKDSENKEEKDDKEKEKDIESTNKSSEESGDKENINNDGNKSDTKIDDEESTSTSKIEDGNGDNGSKYLNLPLILLALFYYS